ncbi:hypothetical protein KIPB_005502 [Kipferlia bialata]|uniref:Uncharacterized protein n=1 Tax=Kipferlia bialata TaxID=797122 RepID=A0A9K3GJ36_9EUKA|nr:hypothetical protein KIPB_005502 [Kipferlia bialata]|eukprot:g5502.t1
MPCRPEGLENTGWPGVGGQEEQERQADEQEEAIMNAVASALQQGRQRSSETRFRTVEELCSTLDVGVESSRGLHAEVTERVTDCSTSLTRIQDKGEREAQLATADISYRGGKAQQEMLQTSLPECLAVLDRADQAAGNTRQYVSEVGVLQQRLVAQVTRETGQLRDTLHDNVATLKSVASGTEGTATTALSTLQQTLEAGSSTVKDTLAVSGRKAIEEAERETSEGLQRVKQTAGGLTSIQPTLAKQGDTPAPARRISRPVSPSNLPVSRERQKLLEQFRARYGTPSRIQQHLQTKRKDDLDVLSSPMPSSTSMPANVPGVSNALPDMRSPSAGRGSRSRLSVSTTQSDRERSFPMHSSGDVSPTAVRPRPAPTATLSQPSSLDAKRVTRRGQTSPLTQSPRPVSASSGTPTVSASLSRPATPTLSTGGEASEGMNVTPAVVKVD